MRLVVLVDNTVFSKGLVAEHGLSLYGEYRGRRFLFDLGQSRDSFLRNADVIGLEDIGSIDFVVISHSHYDHTGGLLAVVESLGKATSLYASSRVTRAKYRAAKGSRSYIGIPVELQDRLCDAVTLDLSFRERRVGPGIWVIPSAPDYGYPLSLRSHLLNEDGEVDAFKDEVYLCLEHEEGLVVISGCSHRGIMNIICHVKKVTGIDKVKAVIGGLHIRSFEEGLEVGRYMNDMGIDSVYPMHCTRPAAICGISSVFEGRCEVVGCGGEIVL